MKRIKVTNAAENNLKNLNFEIPHNSLTVVTGVSGSGKSSLAFGTLFAEGQMRYVESLSSFARQFLSQRGHPKVDLIEGLLPAIAIDQKSTSKNPRSTVGTLTEIYDYLRILWARVGVPYCDNCGRALKHDTVESISKAVLAMAEGSRFEIIAPYKSVNAKKLDKTLEEVKRLGFVRVSVNGELILLDELVNLEPQKDNKIELIVDRLVVREDIRSRVNDSIETALRYSEKGIITIKMDEETLSFSTKYGCAYCETHYPELSPQLFSFNIANGACETCSGLGYHYHIDPEKLIPDPSLSIAQGGIDAYAWKNLKEGSMCKVYYERLSKIYKFSLDTPLSELDPKIIDILFYGSGDMPVPVEFLGKIINTPFEGIIQNLENRYNSHAQFKSTKKNIEKLMYLKACNACGGSRLNRHARNVKIQDMTISDFVALPIHKETAFLRNLELSVSQKEISKQVMEDILSRLSFIEDVGLEYLTLDRASMTLSGGEAQRIRLASQIGSKLIGVLYVMDEPSIGLHQKDNDKLLKSLLELRDLGNTLVVVEHDEDTIRQADWVLDVGPLAGEAGGEIISEGSLDYLLKNKKSITAQYLNGKKIIDYPKTRRTGNGKFLEVVNATENNLKNVSVSIPAGMFVCVTGVSGSGKSSLVNEVIHKSLAKKLNKANTRPGKVEKILGVDSFDKVIQVTQDPIGRTPKSNPATYTGVFDDIRNLFSKLPEARMRGYGPSRFSFNVSGGRCDKCSGEGVIRVEMQLLPDVYVTCDECHGTRFNPETLSVKYKDHGIDDVLAMSVNEAIELFSANSRIMKKLNALKSVGLGYIKLGQSSTTLSGGEAQRVKLASELLRPDTGNTLYIFDEPTTGLHFEDINQLVKVLQAIVDNGNTIIVIEHNLDVIKNADLIIDLGPGGGEHGGSIVGVGTPEELSRNPQSFTGDYLKKYLK